LFLVDPEHALSPYALLLLTVLAVIAYQCAVRAARRH
jgi:hypothetical protein